MTRVVVVGGGAAGASVVRTLHGAGYDGTVVLLCGEPVAPYDRTMLSKGSLLVPGDAPRPLLPDSFDDGLDVSMRLGAAATSVDLARRIVHTDRGVEVGYDLLVLATGAAPRHLRELPGADHEAVHTIREIAGWGPVRDAVVGARRLVVIGGGLIGLEVAAAARAHGGEVTVVEVADRLMGRVLPGDVAEVAAAEHAARGVTIELGSRPTAIVDGGAQGPGVELADGRVLPADAVLISVGSQPRLDLAEAAGLRVEDGIVVDQHLRTSDPHVLAAGDAVRVMSPDGVLRPRTESWTPAVSMGQHAARTILGQPATYDDVPWMWSDQYDLRIQAAGAAVTDLEQVRRGSPDDPAGLVVFGLDRGQVAGVAGVSRGNGIGRTIRAGQLLIQHAVAIDAETLSDTGGDLRRLVPRR